MPAVHDRLVRGNTIPEGMTPERPPAIAWIDGWVPMWCQAPARAWTQHKETENGQEYHHRPAVPADSIRAQIIAILTAWACRRTMPQPPPASWSRPI